MVANMLDDLLQLDNQLCFSLYAATRAMTQAYRPLLEQLKLTYPQYLVMLVLWEKNPVSVSEIGKRLILDSGTLTPLLKRLGKVGYITRQRSKEDERVTMISLTEEGKKLEDIALQVPQEIICRFAYPMERTAELREELHELRRAIEKITIALQEDRVEINP